MRPLFALFGFALVLLLLAGVSSEAGGAKMPVKPLRTWGGKVMSDEEKSKKLFEESPKTGYVTDRKVWEKLWRAWRADEKVPPVDFAKEVVFVSTAQGPNQVRASFTVDGAGDLRVMALATLVGGPGFGYSFDVLSRDDFKTYKGKPLPAGE